MWRGLRTPLIWLQRRRQLVRIRHSGVDRPRWWHDRFLFVVLKALTVVLAVIFLAWVARSVGVLIGQVPKDFPRRFNPDQWCGGKGVSCGAVTGWITSLLSIAVASAVFLLWRLSWVRGRYLHTARHHPRDLVPTAGTIIGRVVGRDQLCAAIMEDLRLRRSRRPHLLVGGVGTGKTAVVVQLTELLARRHAVPVPIRLREADELDFSELAKKRFLDEIRGRLTSEAEGERTWRRLLRDGRIVVLADGLEEAMADSLRKDPGRKVGERDTQIRNAIREAHRQRLPLLIASRPHSPLRGMDATIHELEPLSEDDALSYVREETPTEDDWRLSWIVEMADVAEAPLYLQITRELSRLDMLDRIASRDAQILQSPTYDRSTLRLRLFQAWEEALIRGRLYPEVALSRPEREITLEWISAFAVTGLKNDTLEVGLLDPLPDSVKDEVKRRCDKVVQRSESDATAVARNGLRTIDGRLAAAWGAQLGLVELGANRVRFEHSLVQAYLGARLMDAAFLDTHYRQEALFRQKPEDAQTEGRPRPGREVLIALVLYSRASVRRPVPSVLPTSGVQSPQAARSELCKSILDAANEHYDNKALDMYTAALEIAGAPDQPDTTRQAAQARARTRVTGGEIRRIGQVLNDRWPDIRSDDLRTLEEAKIGLVRRFGEALRGANESSHRHVGPCGYKELYDLCSQEDSYRVRLAGAMEIGQGGCVAYHELKDHLAAPSRNSPARSSEHGKQLGEKPQDTRHRWARQVTAWVVPLLVTSVDPGCDDPDQEDLRRELRKTLQQWREHVGGQQDRQLRIPEEIALAQGFKYAANQRHRHLHTRPDAWSYLEDQALEMLKQARYWFSELTLIQALTLWALPAGSEPPKPGNGDDSSATQQPRQHPDEIVRRWRNVIANKTHADVRGKQLPVHPFVEAAADLAIRALTAQQPGRFLWMDETDAVSRVGAGQPKKTSPTVRQPAEWIPPWMGWSALDAEAQKLLADVLVLLNLADRGETPEETEDRLKQANVNELPPCITRDRRCLQPLHTVGTAESHRPGSSCLDGCDFQLCPYPPKGLQHHRTELSEEFCRHQYRLARRYLRIGRHTASWQSMWGGRLREFWVEMADRAGNGTSMDAPRR